MSDRRHEVGITWKHRNEVLEFDLFKWFKPWYNIRRQMRLESADPLIVGEVLRAYPAGAERCRRWCTLQLMAEDFGMSAGTNKEAVELENPFWVCWTNSLTSCQFFVFGIDSIFAIRMFRT